MAETRKVLPDSLDIDIWAQSGTKTNPGSSLYTNGWVQQVIRDDFWNFIIGRDELALANVVQQGIVDWNPSVTYWIGSGVNFSTSINPTVNPKWYKCLTDEHISATTPAADTTNWIPLDEFSSAVQTFADSKLANVVIDGTSLAAPITSPTFLGVPAAPTPPIDDDSTRIATTEYYQNQSASQSDVNAGVSTGKYVSPLTLLSERDGFLSTNGFFTFPKWLSAGISSQNLTIQWGQTNITSRPVITSISINFNTTFSNVFSVVATPVSTSSQNTQLFVTNVNSITTSGFKAQTDSGVGGNKTYGINWFAVGRI